MIIYKIEDFTQLTIFDDFLVVKGKTLSEWEQAREYMLHVINIINKIDDKLSCFKPCLTNLIYEINFSLEVSDSAEEAMAKNYRKIRKLNNMIGKILKVDL